MFFFPCQRIPRTIKPPKSKTKSFWIFIDVYICFLVKEDFHILWRLQLVYWKFILFWLKICKNRVFVCLLKQISVMWGGNNRFFRRKGRKWITINQIGTSGPRFDSSRIIFQSRANHQASLKSCHERRLSMGNPKCLCLLDSNITWEIVHTLRPFRSQL